jgi:hypothetical protein
METVFERAFRSAYWDDNIHESALKSIRAAAPYPEVGAPAHADLVPGETRPAELACSFVDLRGFTKLALAKTPAETVRILNAVLLAANVHFRGYGGWILDYSDGAMAVFEGPDLTQAVWRSLEASAFLLSGIQIVVNNDLGQHDDPTVRAAIGMEAGEVLWTRLGDDECSQVKPISGVTFLAGKNCSGGQTNAWEALMGKRIAVYVPDELKTRADPYDFQFEKVEYHEPRWLFNWQEYLADYTRDRLGLQRALSTKAAVTAASVASASFVATRPTRPLRDAPYA